MTSSVLERKLAVAFSQIDLGRTGRIDRHAVLNLARRILATFDEQTSTPKGREILSLYGWYWDCLCAHAGVPSSASMNQQEYGKAFTEAFIDGEKFAAVYGPMALATVRIADADNDGNVSQHELTQLWKAFGSSIAQAEAAFSALDSNGDGLISVLEILDALRDYYTNDTAESPGNVLFGYSLTT